MFALLGIVAFLSVAIGGPAVASPEEQYSKPYFGEDNFPPGCIRDMSPRNPNNICYHMRTGLNALDSPQIDVLVMVPVSPTAERDMRIMRQSVEMWEGGMDYLAGQMGLDWVSSADFHVTVDYVDLQGDEGGELTTYPIMDPEIVVIASNPVGGVGIGIDPVNFVFTGEDGVPCHNTQNPFDFEYWENLPGFNNHHQQRTGTYVEDCDGAGGNICFAINGAIDPEPGTLDVFNLFDLVSHEFGHCLTLGHVGDGAEGSWGPVPTNDIMAYSSDPPGLNKCVSTLDVEVFATRMSRYLDVNGDGTVTDADRLLVNDQIGEGGNPFQVQHPSDHQYASATGSPLDCPQPDLGPAPGARTDWTPEPAASTRPELTVTGPSDGAKSTSGAFSVTGTVARIPVNQAPPDPTEPTGSYDDADDDATTPVTEILDLRVAVTATHIDATMRLADIWPTTSVLSPTVYSLVIDGRKFDSFVRYPIDSNPMTWDGGGYMPAGSSSWDLAAKTVSFHIPRSTLAPAIVSPYFVSAQTAYGALTTGVVDDTAPEPGNTVGVANSHVLSAAGLSAPAPYASEPVNLERAGGNTFYPYDTSFGSVPLVGVGRSGLGAPVDSSHRFTLDVPARSTVEFHLTWDDDVGGSDLDLYVTGAADGASATSNPRERALVYAVEGRLEIRVEPYVVTDATGLEYTLTAIITSDRDGDAMFDASDQCPDAVGSPPTGCPDRDRDGVLDHNDVCADEPGNGADGCPIGATEHVHVYVDGTRAASQDVDTANSSDSFAIPVQVPQGTHALRIEWEDEGAVLATTSRTVIVGPDTDGDGVNDAADNCPNVANADQSNIDRDGKGDACDSDMDGDGHANSKEQTHGTDPKNPNSYPTKKK